MISAQTWIKNQPGLLDSRWLIFHDIDPETGMSSAEAQGVVEASLQHRAQHVNLVPWPVLSHVAKPDYESQRSKMLAGHVYVPAMHAKTKWSVKIDTDAVCLQSRNWPLDEWFRADHIGRDPVIVASGWPYTKAKGGGGTISDWCHALEHYGDRLFPNRPRLDLIDRVRGDKMRLPRFASWICFQRTAWIREIAAATERECGQGKLPVPSHDTTLWYAAARGGFYYHTAKQKRHGWTNIPSYSRLLKAVREIVE
jgi:hypothetical protein